MKTEDKKNNDLLIYQINNKKGKLLLSECKKIIKINKIYKYPFLNKIYGFVLYENNLIPIINNNSNGNLGVWLKSKNAIMIVDNIISMEEK